ncbi:DinB family protein [Granulicella sibirica]|uniref:DinB family protein n=1 Tax=Granulicella sibirica TaxID=2479048 RepID=A0A4V1L5G7_9BACT|nr:DinB family protein [Granulicella sibirica]RXH55704.1 hypothetical protein GRAN_2561 [Granulicella sibirica]
MPFSTLLTAELASEFKNTRKILERLPDSQGEFRPHDKSMPLGKLAGHVAQLPSFMSIILTTPAYDFGKTKSPSLVFESAGQIAAAFDELATKAQSDLAGTSDEAFEEIWKLTYNDQPIFSGTRFHAYRLMGINHMIHHRAQLGVYLRLLNQPVPGLYGPSADDKMGF